MNENTLAHDVIERVESRNVICAKNAEKLGEILFVNLST